MLHDLVGNGVFSHLLNLSISASFLVLAVLVLRFLLKKAPKWISCLLWGLVGLRLVFPFSIESVFSLIPSAETVPPDIVYMAEPTINSGITVVDNIANPVLLNNFAPAGWGTPNPLYVALEIVTGIWLLGIVAMLAYMLVGYIRLRFRLRTAVKLADNLYQSEKVSSPFIFGMIKPRIYLPFSMDEADMAPVIAHEKAHLRRLDHLIKPLAYLILAVYWFNPLLWVAYILLCRDIELACDEKVVRKMDAEQKKAYSYALLRCSMNHHSRLACPLAFGEVGVKERVKNVMHYKKPAFWILILAVVAVVVTAVCFLTVPKDENKEEDLSQASYYRAIEICGAETKFFAQFSPHLYMNAVYGINDKGAIYEKMSEEMTWRLIGERGKEMNMSQNAMRKVFADTFAFQEEKLTFDQLFDETEKIYRFDSEDEDGNKWFNQLFLQENGDLYWGYGLAEDHLIRVLWKLVCAKPSPNANLMIPNDDVAECVGYYEAVEDIGLHAAVPARRPFYEQPYYYIDVSGRLFSQKRGETTWAFLGGLSKLDITEARMTASQHLTVPFMFEDESGTGGDSAIRNMILSGITGMWTLTTTENEVEWTYYFIQVNNGAMYLGQGQSGAMFWLYRMECVDTRFETSIEPATEPFVSIDSARALRSDLEVKASHITFDDHFVTFRVSFENLSKDVSLYYNGISVLGKTIAEGHDRRIEWQDGGAPFALNDGYSMSREFKIDRDLLDDGEYRLHIFFAIESGDFNIENAPCAEVVFNYTGFEES